MVVEDRLSPEMAARGMALEKTVTPAIYYLGFNMDDPVVGAPAGVSGKFLRQAMSLAIDSENTRVFSRTVAGCRPTRSFPPASSATTRTTRIPTGRWISIGAASSWLKRATREGSIRETDKPLRLTFDVSDTSSQAVLRFTWFVNQWRKLGIDVRLDATNYNQFQAKVRNGAYQLFMWGWVADYPDPENFLFLLTTGMARSVSNGPNSANFQDPRYDALFKQMETAENGPGRRETIEQMRSILEEERPWIELFYPEEYSLFHGWLANVKPAGISNPTLKYRDLDVVARRDAREGWNQPVMWPAYALAVLVVVLVVPAFVTYFRERQ